MHTDTDTLHFLDDESDANVSAGLVWRLMIIDDEPDVHRATTFALAGVKILGRPLQFLHAYSAAEATQQLRTESDVAVILLDVVMEREDAGLALVKTIRQDLRLTELRIILRTGQPGYAPEIETIHDAGTHRIFIGRVVSTARGKSSPLIYSNRKFGRMAALDGETT